MPHETKRRPAPAAEAVQLKETGRGRAKPATTKPDEQPGYAKQTEALEPKKEAAGGLSNVARPKLKKLKVLKISISGKGKMTAQVEATVEDANFQKGTAVRVYTIETSSSRNPMECAELIADKFEREHYLRDTGLDMYALTEKRLEALKMEGYKAMQDGRLDDQH